MKPKNIRFACQICFLLLFSNFVHAQCPPAGVIQLATQADVNNFVAMYPNCTQLEGSLTIGNSFGSTDINNLAGLNQLVEVMGAFSIQNTQLTSLDDFNNLQTVQNTFRISKNDVLTSISGFNALTSVGAFFSTSLSISENAALQEISGFNDLPKVPQGLSFYDNDALTTISGFNSINEILGSLVIYNNALLTDLNGFNNAQQILAYLTSSIFIKNNASLTSLSGLQRIKGNAATGLIGQITIEDNPALTEIAAFNLVFGVPELIIKNNDALSDLDGFASLFRINTEGNIDDNDQLSSMSGFSTLEEVLGDISFSNNPQLTSFSDLSALRQVDGELILEETAFTNFNSLSSNLTATGGLRIEDNPNLTSLDGLEDVLQLTEANPFLVIRNNAILQSITGITNLTGPISTNIIIQNNPNLASCHIASICTFLGDGGGGTSIHSNAFGCDEAIRVEIACGQKTPNIYDECSTPLVVAVQAEGTGCGSPEVISNVNATNSYNVNGIPTCDGDLEADVWVEFVAPTSKAIKIELPTNEWANFRVALYDDCNDMVEIACYDLFQAGFIKIGNLTANQTYYLRMWDAFTNGEYGNLSFCLEALPLPPAHDECAGAIAVTVDAFNSGCANPTTANNLLATSSAPINGVPSCWNFQGEDLWYKFTAPSSTQVKVIKDAASTLFSVGFSLYDQCNNMVELQCDQILGNSGELRFSNLTAGNEYYLRIWDFGGDQQGTVVFCIEALPPPPTNDICANATVLTVGDNFNCPQNSISGTTLYASEDINTDCNTSNPIVTVWYRFTAPAGGLVQLFLGTNVGFTLFDGCMGNIVYCFDGPNRPSNLYIPNLQPSNDYYIQVWADESSPENFDICLSEPTSTIANDHCVNATMLTVGDAGTCPANEVSATTVDALEDGEISCSPTPNNGIWFNFVAPPEGQIIYDLTLNGGGFFPKIAFFDACGGNEIHCNFQSGGLVENLVPGNTYLINISSNQNQGNSFTFCVSKPYPKPANDDCTNTQFITVHNFGDCPSLGISGTTLGATDDVDATCGDSFDQNGVWFAFTAPPSGEIELNLDDSGFSVSPKITIYDDCEGTEHSCIFFPSIDNVTGLTPNAIYLINVFSSPGEEEDFDLCLEAIPSMTSNQDCNTAITIGVGEIGTCNELFGHTAGATNSGIANPSCANYQGGDVWYELSVPASGNVTIETSTSGIFGDGGMAAYSGTCGNLTLIECDDNDGPGSMPQLDLTNQTSGETIWLRVWENGNNSTLYFDICAYEPASPCDPPFLKTTITTDCEAETFTIDITITDFGTATTVDIIYTGSTISDAILNEMYSIGPFPVGMPIDIQAKDQDIPTCFSDSNGNTGNCNFPDNDDVCNHQDLDAFMTTDGSFNYQTYSNIGATTQTNEVTPKNRDDCSNGNSWCDGFLEGDLALLDHSVWFSFTAPASGDILVTTRNMDTQLAAWEAADCTDLLTSEAMMVQANDDASEEELAAELFLNCLIPFKRYYVQVDGYGGEEDLFDIAILHLTNGPPCSLIGNPNPGQDLSCGDEFVPPPFSEGYGEWLHFENFNGRVASINDKGVDLGTVTLDFMLNGDGVRQNGDNIYYLDRNYQITTQNPVTSPVCVRFYFDANDLNSLNALDSYVDGPDKIGFTKISNQACGDFPGIPTGTVEQILAAQSGDYIAGTFYIDVLVNEFSAFYLHSNSSFSLPLKLLNLKGKTKEEYNLLQWTTATEKDLAYFQIERSTDGQANWQAIEKVFSKGNFSISQSYETLDQQPLKKAFYRLKIIEQSGKAEFSETIFIERELQGIDWQIVPNPAQESFQITLNLKNQEAAQINIRDLLGRPIWQSKTSDEMIKVDCQDWVAGVYLIQLQINGQSFVQKLVVE